MWEYTESTELANMSKMPAKKKSCFQITSVTQAQVAASNTADDTESLDDPDESRTEDVSSEIFDVSRVDLAVCDRNSSEETLNNVGDTQEGQAALTASVNEGLPNNKSAVGGVLAPHHSATNVSAAAATAQPIAAPAATVPSTTVAPVNTCSSRFRVIKLDHGTGEPFRRGRWTCTEFHDKDSDSNGNRTVDSIKPTVTLDHSVERDSGIGTTSNIALSSSASSSQALENAVDSGHTATNPTHSSETVQQGFGLVPQIGSGASAFQPTGYSTISSKQTQHALVSMQPAAPQTFLSNNLKGVHQGSLQQKSPIPPPATQVQHFPYSNHPVGQPDYRQQQFGSNPLPITPHSVGPSSLILPAGSLAQGLGVEAPSAQGLLLHMAPRGGQQQLVNHTQPSGGLGLAPKSSATSGVLNVPVTLPTTTSTPTGGASQAPFIIIQPQGAHGGATTGLLTGFSNQAENGQPKSEVLPQPSGSVLPGKDNMKPFITEGLGLPSPAVNSLFGIHITMDGDEDSASGASVVAIDNKIEQAMDLVKSHLMYAVREEVEVLKEQIKELYERNSMLERENAVLKSLANSDQLNHLSNHGSTSPPPQQQQHSAITNNSAPLTHHEGSQSVPHQPNITSA
ncbi:TSC22 domain family protein 2 isoform X2 [Phyllopteryx taeniolatus]|uniref:TSC22 domain family protein 2 isoform X2 n=1 Tax=Phyllopteryx taeniolatus TaxID=161469 RepID=UPI002AD23D8B|nr:TSC22 domain family protein 2 isoform X2 [Phyllopteryx taeniolatus]